MRRDEIVRSGLLLTLCLAALLALTGWVVGDAWSLRHYLSDSPVRGAVTGFPGPGGMTVEQRLPCRGEQAESMTLELAPAGAGWGGEIRCELLVAGETRLDTVLPLSGPAADTLTIPLGGTDIRGGELLFRLTLTDPEDTGLLPALWTGDSVDAGRLTVAAENLDGLRINGEPRHGRLCCAVRTLSHSGVMAWYWPAAAALTLLGILETFRAAARSEKGKPGAFLRLAAVRRRYAFLLEQLVSRNFQTKYRQSILGVLWSFLNPLLTMAVQYVVFSTLFRSAIPNFPVYLICGIILFNFFTEATNLGLESITASGPLLTKVALPKYIFPVSRTVSAVINLLISLVPLLLLMALTGVPFTRALLLTPLVIALLFGFALGMALILSTLHVFFRDVKFLWSVVILLWSYATPIFYPETIIPAAVLPVYRLNPMYQFITFLRTLVLDGTVPPPLSWLACLACSALPLAVGIAVFRRKQDSFVFYL